MATRHFITGVSGFLGRKTVDKLLAAGNEVIGIDIHRDPRLSQDIEFHIADIRDLESVSKLMKGADVVHNHAALVPLTRAYNDFWSVNVNGVASVAKAARVNEVQTFMHTSSSAVYGSTKDVAIDANTPLKPFEPYGKSKYEGEIAVKKILGDSDVRLAVIRPRTILGGERGGIFDLFFRWIRDGKPVFIVGKGNNKFQFVHETDLLSAYFAILNSSASGDFNVGTQHFGTLNEVFSHVINFANSESKVVHLPVFAAVNGAAILEKTKLSPLAPWHYKSFHHPFYFDMSPLEELGWSSVFSNNELFEFAYSNFIETGGSSTTSTSSPHSRPLDGKILEKIQRVFR